MGDQGLKPVNPTIYKLNVNDEINYLNLNLNLKIKSGSRIKIFDSLHQNIFTLTNTLFIDALTTIVRNWQQITPFSLKPDKIYLVFLQKSKLM